ncbi:SMI1/KNR4 family protein [Streptomyces sp. NBC_01724]|uniref:SMI1/KNR4 family protein n=1 Tax=unclassified Streptomyces TaxID=2593676 RepID=UPI0028C50635|nr:MULTISPECIES: SMI1/KNR4 family protein [unclassified Streptomyces]WTE55011.1 SMI1/KNR4 family protein [Streptomyces sp. NBC_01620]WTE63086.1 SMI1/KNR4 family protein [Streptomyces sp. NBC_01617]WTI90383.1 SMI1/KNR4 family protein [Streptomyces sp. NBC_00724]WNO67986.1 SMI1/KNR4 family protein [Streptomyces sp. AM2-3-1]WSC72651.1 SMI1/KNR4 family protein [Streptomyces sp. NBC_01760]
MSSNDDQIAQAEDHFGVRFPEDYRHFLAREGSMARFVPPADDFLMINALTELIEVNEAGDFQERFPRSVVIGGDGSREMLTYDFRQEPPSLVLLDVSAQDWSSGIQQATSFSALLEQFPETGWTWDESEPSPS